MNKHVLIIFISVIISLMGCQSDFKIGEPTTEELFLLCFPGPSDTTIIQLYKTVPIGGRYEGSPFLESADIIFSTNGVVHNVEYANSPVGSVPKGCWFVPTGIVAGDMVDISSFVDGVKPISAHTQAPLSPPLFSYRWNADDIRVSFDDDSESKDYYGLALVCEQTFEDNGIAIVNTHFMPPLSEGNGTTEISVLREYYDIGFTGWSLCPNRVQPYGVRVWSDESFNGTKVSLSMRIDLSPIESHAIVSRFKVRLYRFSEEFYRYLAALDYQTLNGYASYGIVPMKPSFTNINGGSGVLAGWSMRETDWFEKND